METLVQAIVIGIVQGLTEFLPISSSAHLIVVPRLAGWHDPFLNSAAFDVMLHLGTVAALLAYFGRDYIVLARAFFASLREQRIGADPERRLAWLLAASLVPAAIVGFLFEEFFDTAFREQILFLAVFLVVGAGLLFIAERIGSHRRDIHDLKLVHVLAIGCAQVLALFPGISRSGITIAAGLTIGLERAAAARFAFLMATPITLAAGIWKTREVATGGLGSVDLVVLAGGMIAAAVSGLLAIRFLLAFLRRQSTDLFAVYRLGFAAVIVAAWMSGNLS